MSVSEAFKPAELTENATIALAKRYLARDETGKVIETPDQLFCRVAGHVASAEAAYGATPEETNEVARIFYEMMASLLFLPNSPTLMNAGTDLGQLSACFVLPIGDSMTEIFDAVKHAALIHQSGGGTGFSFSKLRPAGDMVKSTKGVSSGPLSFMHVFDAGADVVKQGGKRRGANMGMLRVDHPDILEFIKCKDDTSKLTNFNISVAATDKFMEAVAADADYELINPRTGQPSGTLKAREVFDLIVKQAWKNGEPGIVFIDRINEHNPVPHLGNVESTNPCGEQPLLPYESCNLGSINVSRLAKNGEIDLERLRSITRIAVRFLDNVIDVNQYPLVQIGDMTRQTRKIGLGLMGFADLLVELGIPYGSKEALATAELVMGTIQDEGRLASMELAKARGTFPGWKGSTYAEANLPVRNATVTTIAPTGTLSILAGCSSGIEPLFAVAYERTVLEGTRMYEVNRAFLAAMEREGLIVDEEMVASIAKVGSIAHIDGIPDHIKRLFVTAHDVAPGDHVRMQAYFQRHTDNAVSKTVNLRREATEKDVKQVYLDAYNKACKGVTVYRDGSRASQPLSTSASSSPTVAQTPTHLVPRKRPTTTIGSTKEVKAGCGKIYVTVNQDEQGMPFEVFTRVGKGGGCAAAQSESLGRLVSLALRSGVGSELIIKEMKGIGCHQPAWGEGGRVASCSDAIAKVLEQFEPLHVNGNGNGIMYMRPDIEEEVQHSGACPDCGGALEHEGGCAVCHSCIYSQCS